MLLFHKSVRVPVRSVQREKATIIKLQLLTGQVVHTVVSNTRVTRLGFGAWLRAYKFEQERRNEKMKVQHSPPPAAVHAHTKRQKTHPLICFKGAITRYLLSPFKESLNVFRINRIPKVMIQFCYSLRRHLGIESAFCRPCNE